MSLKPPVLKLVTKKWNLVRSFCCPPLSSVVHSEHLCNPGDRTLRGPWLVVWSAVEIVELKDGTVPPCLLCFLHLTALSPTQMSRVLLIWTIILCSVIIVVVVDLMKRNLSRLIFFYCKGHSRFFFLLAKVIRIFLIEQVNILSNKPSFSHIKGCVHALCCSFVAFPIVCRFKHSTVLAIAINTIVVTCWKMLNNKQTHLWSHDKKY